MGSRYLPAFTSVVLLPDFCFCFFYLSLEKKTQVLIFARLWFNFHTLKPSPNNFVCVWHMGPHMEKLVCLLVLIKTGEREILRPCPWCHRGIRTWREAREPIMCANVDSPMCLSLGLGVAFSWCLAGFIPSVAFPPGMSES